MLPHWLRLKIFDKYKTNIICCILRSLVRTRYWYLLYMRSYVNKHIFMFLSDDILTSHHTTITHLNRFNLFWHGKIIVNRWLLMIVSGMSTNGIQHCNLLPFTSMCSVYVVSVLNLWRALLHRLIVLFPFNLLNNPKMDVTIGICSWSFSFRSNV